MKQFVVEYLSLACQQAERVRGCISELADTDLNIELTDGRKIALYVVNRAIRVPEIRERYERNTRRKLHTLYVIDGRMIPSEGIDIEPPHWMAALHTLSHGRVYAYWCEKREVIIRPVHMDWKWGENARHIEYGAPVTINNIRASMVSAATRTIDGTFATADFGEGAFWKKRDPNENRYNQYSWRQWSYSTNARSRAQEEKQQTSAEWDTWQDFQEHYANAEDFGATGDYERGRKTGRDQKRYADSERSQSSGRSNRKQGQEARTYTVLTHHYATLGLKATASYDEVKRAYRTKAREFHPDLHPEHSAKYTLKMAEINAAFEAISATTKVKK